MAMLYLLQGMEHQATHQLYHHTMTHPLENLILILDNDLGTLNWPAYHQPTPLTSTDISHHWAKISLLLNSLEDSKEDIQPQNTFFPSHIHSMPIPSRSPSTSRVSSNYHPHYYQGAYTAGFQWGKVGNQSDDTPPLEYLGGGSRTYFSSRLSAAILEIVAFTFGEHHFRVEKARLR